MTNDQQQSGNEQPKPIPFGMRLQTAREALGLDRKDVAAQLRLNEKIIIMMEKDRYSPDLPVTFIRGYIRAYGKFLQMPESDIKKALEPIKPQATQQNPAAGPGKVPIFATQPVTSGHYFMQFFTFLIVCTIGGLVGAWWYLHPTIPAPLLADKQPVQTSPVIAVATAPSASPTWPTQTAPTLTPNAELAKENTLAAVAAPSADHASTESVAPPVAPVKPFVAPTPKPIIARAKPTKPAVEVIDLANDDLNSSDDE